MWPTNKRHILFFSTEQNGEKKLFLKPENYGTKEWIDFLPHGYEYIESVAVRSGFVTHGSEKEINHRKERTKYLPDNIKALLTKCRKLLGAGDLSVAPDEGDFVLVQNTQELEEGLRKQGISYLIRLFEERDTTKSEELSEVLKELKAALAGRQLDHLGTRVAQEVIFTKEELIGSGKVAAATASEALGGNNEQESMGKKNGNGLQKKRIRKWQNFLLNFSRKNPLSNTSKTELEEAEKGNKNTMQQEDRTSATDTAESSLPGQGESMHHGEDRSEIEVSDADEEKVQESGSGVSPEVKVADNNEPDQTTQQVHNGQTHKRAKKQTLFSRTSGRDGEPVTRHSKRLPRKVQPTQKMKLGKK